MVLSLSVCILSAACVAGSVSLRALILIASGYVAVVVDCVSVFSVVVCEDIVKV